MLLFWYIFFELNSSIRMQSPCCCWASQPAMLSDSGLRILRGLVLLVHSGHRIELGVQYSGFGNQNEVNQNEVRCA